MEHQRDMESILVGTNQAKVTCNDSTARKTAAAWPSGTGTEVVVSINGLLSLTTGAKFGQGGRVGIRPVRPYRFELSSLALGAYERRLSLFPTCVGKIDGCLQCCFVIDKCLLQAS